MKEVEALIPHRDPFLYLDKIISLSKDEIIGETIFHCSNGFLSGSFPKFNYVPGVILIEAMAQCGGAGIKKLDLAKGLFGFANIESATFYRGVEYGAIFRMENRSPVRRPRQSRLPDRRAECWWEDSLAKWK